MIVKLSVRNLSVGKLSVIELLGGKLSRSTERQIINKKCFSKSEVSFQNDEILCSVENRKRRNRNLLKKSWIKRNLAESVTVMGLSPLAKVITAALASSSIRAF